MDPEEDASETIKRVLQELDNGVIASRKKLKVKRIFRFILSFLIECGHSEP